jgi:hypothetical protein
MGETLAVMGVWVIVAMGVYFQGNSVLFVTDKVSHAFACCCDYMGDTCNPCTQADDHVPAWLTVTFTDIVDGGSCSECDGFNASWVVDFYNETTAPGDLCWLSYRTVAELCDVSATTYVEGQLYYNNVPDPGSDTRYTLGRVNINTGSNQFHYRKQDTGVGLAKIDCAAAPISSPTYLGGSTAYCDGTSGTCTIDPP